MTDLTNGNPRLRLGLFDDMQAAKKQKENFKKSIREYRIFIKECDDKKMHAIDRLKHLEKLEKPLQQQFNVERTQRQKMQQQLNFVPTQSGESAVRRRRFPNESDNG